MNKKTIQLTAEQAKKLYNENNSYRTTLLSDFTDEELGIRPHVPSWEDVATTMRSYYPHCTGAVEKEETFIHSELHLNVPSEKHAKSMFAFAKLSTIMAAMGDECDVNWNDDKCLKHVIAFYRNKMIKWSTNNHRYFLAFKTASVRNEFLEKHRQLIEEYFML